MKKIIADDDPFYLMVYDFDHNKKFDKRFDVEMFQHPKVIHFWIPPSLKNEEDSMVILNSSLTSFYRTYKFKAILHKV